MSKVRALVIFGLGIGVVLGGTYIYRQLLRNADLARSATLEAKRLQEQTDRVAERLESLSLQQQGVSQLVQQGQSAPPSVDAERRASAETRSRKAFAQEGPPSKQALEEAALRRDAHYAFVDSVLKAERRDATWARATEARVTEQLSSYPALAGFKVTEATCTSTLCKLEGTLSNEDEFAVVRQAIQTFNFATETMVRRIDDGRTGARVVSYFSREGKSLPRVPE